MSLFLRLCLQANSQPNICLCFAFIMFFFPFFFHMCNSSPTRLVSFWTATSCPHGVKGLISIHSLWLTNVLHMTALWLRGSLWWSGECLFWMGWCGNEESGGQKMSQFHFNIKAWTSRQCISNWLYLQNVKWKHMVSVGNYPWLYEFSRSLS